MMRSKFAAFSLLSPLLLACPAAVDKTPDAGSVDAGTPGAPDWDPVATPPACGLDGETPLLDTTLARMGRTLETFGSSQEDLNASGYETGGILADPFVLSWFKETRANPARIGCFEGEVAHVLDTYLAGPHPVASTIRHASRLLDRAVNDTKPLDPDNLPGDFFDALDAVCAVVPGGECGSREGTLDVELQHALTPVLWALRDVAAVQLARHADTAAGTATFWQTNGGNLALLNPGAPLPAIEEAPVRAYLLAESDAPKLFTAAAKLAYAIEHADLKRFAGLSGTDFNVDTPVGAVRVRDATKHDHADDGKALLLFVDTGGDDSYVGPVGANRSGKVNPVSVAIDLGGNDTYGYREGSAAPNAALLPADSAGRYRGDANYGPFSLSNVSRQGGARDGVAMLFDLGDGNDQYRSLTTSQGYAHQGVGVLFDAGGNDTYQSESTSQGAAQFGIGLLLDKGTGHDTRTAFTNSQGFGYVGGFGALVDGGGNDTYQCNHGDPEQGGYKLYNSPQMPTNGNSSFCQGAGFGRRGTNADNHFSGGLGILRDAGGNDSYEASVFGQGTGYWQGTGILSDGGGDDAYDANYYAQGGAAHYAIGLLSDDGDGDDGFNLVRAARSVHLGSGHDYSVGALLNEGGDDTYAIVGLGAGASNCNGVGLFVDNAGNDTYRAASDYGSGMGNVSGECLGTRPSAASLGLMIDAGGTDTYAYPASDFPVPSEGGTWGHKRNGLASEAGAGVDATGESGIHPGG